LELSTDACRRVGSVEGFGADGVRLGRMLGGLVFGLGLLGTEAEATGRKSFGSGETWPVG
jgi:hypothetical protein